MREEEKFEARLQTNLSLSKPFTQPGRNTLLLYLLLKIVALHLEIASRAAPRAAS